VDGKVFLHSGQGFGRPLIYSGGRMTVYGAIVAAISRKVSAFLNEVRTLVAKAEAIEKQIVTTAKQDIVAIKVKAKSEVTTLKNELIDDIAKL
jgi:hypothetical protein